MKGIFYWITKTTDGCGELASGGSAGFKCLDLLFGNNDHMIGLVWIKLGVDQHLLV